MVFWVATADICHRGAMALLITANPWLTERGEGRVSSGRREWLQGFVMQPTNHNNNTTTVLTTVAFTLALFGVLRLLVLKQWASIAYLTLVNLSRAIPVVLCLGVSAPLNVTWDPFSRFPIQAPANADQTTSPTSPSS
jgi:hypothetical protein